MQTSNNVAQSGLNVYAFTGTTYSGYSGTTDSNGNVSLTLPQGSYRFRADKAGTQYWSGDSNNCTIPGCTTATVTLPATDVSVTKMITYTYDPLNRLVAADYSSGEFFHYTYDNAGNRLTEVKKTTPTGSAQTTNYTYDAANRMTSAGGVAYTWDANGNMLSDGTSTYAYDRANRLVSITSGSNITSFTYNGEGDQLTETTNGSKTTFTLDLNAGLTQVLSDGTNTYSYGLGRISQTASAGTSFFIGDALGSVRQLTDGQGKETLAQWYEPYGDVLLSVGSAKSIYGYTGEMQDGYTGLVFLRARYYDSKIGLFESRDQWKSKIAKSISFNSWKYVNDNPIINVDPRGLFTINNSNPFIDLLPTGGLYHDGQLNIDNTYYSVFVPPSEYCSETCITQNPIEYYDDIEFYYQSSFGTQYYPVWERDNCLNFREIVDQPDPSAGCYVRNIHTDDWKTIKTHIGIENNWYGGWAWLMAISCLFNGNLTTDTDFMYLSWYKAQDIKSNQDIVKGGLYGPDVDLEIVPPVNNNISMRPEALLVTAVQGLSWFQSTSAYSYTIFLQYNQKGARSRAIIQAEWTGKNLFMFGDHDYHSIYFEDKERYKKLLNQES